MRACEIKRVRRTDSPNFIIIIISKRPIWMITFVDNVNRRDYRNRFLQTNEYYIPYIYIFFKAFAFIKYTIIKENNGYLRMVNKNYKNKVILNYSCVGNCLSIHWAAEFAGFHPTPDISKHVCISDLLRNYSTSTFPKLALSGIEPDTSSPSTLSANRCANEIVGVFDYSLMSNSRSQCIYTHNSVYTYAFRWPLSI